MFKTHVNALVEHERVCLGKGLRDKLPLLKKSAVVQAELGLCPATPNEWGAAVCGAFSFPNPIELERSTVVQEALAQTKRLNSDSWNPGADWTLGTRETPSPLRNTRQLSRGSRPG